MSQSWSGDVVETSQIPETANSNDSDSERIPVVGIGASAGGLDAVLQLLRALPTDTGMAYVYIQHLDPGHESQLAEILARSATIPVVDIRDGAAVLPDTVFVIPPNTALEISGGILKLVPRHEVPAPHFLIDLFFHSLAKDCGSQAIAVILSGTGSDGTEGLKAVKTACGITFAQSEKTAKYTGMPASAISSGAIDFVLSPVEIAEELVRIGKHPVAVRRPLEGPAEEEEESLRRIFSLLQKATKVDFNNYKRSTVRRRIGRRMVVRKISEVAEYATYMQEHPGEVSELFRDILIHVTSFFREPGSFAALTEAMTLQLKDRKREEPLRVWVAGCASGEEVYSIAICLDEAMGTAGQRASLQMFGTDISERALSVARKGVYSEALMAEVTPERRSRYFFQVDGGYQIIKSIRESCVFARHDLTTDPPFSRLDIISCRNVLIYMAASLQNHILSTFHFGLKAAGLMVLGSAEAVPSASDLFIPLNREYKIYRKNPVSMGTGFYSGPSSRSGNDLARPQSATPAIVDLQKLVQQAVRSKYSVDGLVITRDMQIVMFQGHTGLYLDPAPGTANFNLVRLIRDELAFKVQGLVFAAIDQNTEVEARGIRVTHNGEAHEVIVRVIPLDTAGVEEPYLLIVFEAHPRVKARIETPVTQAPEMLLDPASLQRRVDELERELSEARSYLRTMTEEHEANAEELRASNEEVRSSNEELQSTNEELGTTKEELQSVNEELTTLNEELKTKNQELGSANDDLKNLFSAANLPILMVGNDLRIRRFTPAAESLLNLIPSDIGRLVNDLRGTIEIPQLIGMLTKAKDDLQVTNVEIQTAGGKWFSVYCRPYRTMDNRIDGAVITFVDVDSLKQSLKGMQEAREYAEAVIATISEPLLVLDRELRVQRAAPSFYRTFQVSPHETEGMLIYELGNGQWNIPRLRVLLESILPHNSSFQDVEVEHSFPKIGYRSMRLNASRIRNTSHGGELILLAIEDVTERREAAEIRYRRLFESAKDGILVLGAETGEIIDVNPHFLQICMCLRADLVGRQLWETGLFELTEQLRGIVEQARRQDSVRLDNHRIEARDGRHLYVDIVANRYTVAGTHVIQCNVRDVTERKRAEDDVRRSNEDLQQFAYAASHDLQEPLRTVRSYTQLITAKYGHALDEEGRQFMLYLQSAAERMSDLIRDLLTYSQVNAAKIRPEPVNSETVLGWTIMNLQMAIADSDAVVTNDPLPTVRIDQMQFVQVFQNLIGNALKYRQPDEPPNIHVSAKHERTEWIFSVRDNGIGFDQRNAERVFGVFKRLHGKDYPGTGIGLSICKKIIENNGGRIWAESSPGKGSTFYFSIPDQHSPAVETRSIEPKLDASA